MCDLFLGCARKNYFFSVGELFSSTEIFFRRGNGVKFIFTEGLTNYMICIIIIVRINILDPWIGGELDGTHCGCDAGGYGCAG